LPGGALAAASAGPVRWVAVREDEQARDHGSGRVGDVTPGPFVTVASVLRDGVEVRLARVDAAAGGAGWRAVRIGGWPVSADTRPRTGPGALAATATLRSRLTGLRGLFDAGVAEARDVGPLGEWTAIPWVATRGPLPLGEVLAAAVVLEREPASPALAAPEVTVEPDDAGGHRATVTWPDGLRSEVDLPPPPRS
jgi:hypothetical protein